MHAEATESAAEEAVSDCEREDPPAGGAQQGHPGPQQAGEPLQRATEAQQDPEGTPQPTASDFHVIFVLVLQLLIHTDHFKVEFVFPPPRLATPLLF